jgi:hypothetical protein
MQEFLELNEDEIRAKVAKDGTDDIDTFLPGYSKVIKRFLESKDGKRAKRSGNGDEQISSS